MDHYRECACKNYPRVIMTKKLNPETTKLPQSFGSMKNSFPKRLLRVRVPPIKCQGIKTKLVNFIFENIRWEGSGRWIEPFLGSGVVLFNANPEEAIVSDSNRHIIRFYQEIQSGKITPSVVEEFLKSEGDMLRAKADDHYYIVRDRFNKEADPLDLLFLNRACFNGVMRFNRSGKFNVPFGHKPNRFRRAYITKIVNQVQWVSEIMEDKKWSFRSCDWSETLGQVHDGDFVYSDPPYYGRHTDYDPEWNKEEMMKLADTCRTLPCGWALSMWNRNIFREDEFLHKVLGDLPMKTFEHFYHVGSTENRRHAMEEALIVKPGFEATTKLAEEQMSAQQTLL